MLFIFLPLTDIGSPNRPTSLFPPGGLNTSNTLLSAASSPTGSISRLPGLSIPSISINHVGNVPFPSPIVSPLRSAGSTPFPSPYSSPTGSSGLFPNLVPQSDATTQTFEEDEEKCDDDTLPPDSTSSLDVKVIPPVTTGLPSITLSPVAAEGKLPGDDADDKLAIDDDTATPPPAATLDPVPAADAATDAELNADASPDPKATES